MPENSIRALIVEDNPEDFQILQVIFSKIKHQRYVLENAQSLSAALEKLKRQEHDVYLVDYLLGPDSGVEFLAAALADHSAAPVIFLTGHGDHDLDVKAMSLGAADFLNKSKLDPDLLERSIRYALDRRDAQEKLQRHSQLLDSVMENMGEGVALVDAQGQVAFLNRAGLEILGWEKGKTLPKWDEDFGFLSIDGEIPIPVEQLPFQKALQGESTEPTEIFLRNAQKPQGVFLSLSARPLRNEKGSMTGAVVVFRDITVLKKAQEQLAHHSLFNALTNLPNKVLFLDRLSQALRRQKRDSRDFFGVLYLTLGGLKKINDTLGEAAGDELLRESAKRLEGLVGTGDSLAHLGGNEFAFLLSGSLKEPEAIRSLESLRQAFTKPFFPDHQEVFLDVSIGVVADSRGYEKAEELLQHSHAAMYWARRRLKNSYEFFRPEMLSGVSENLQLENDLRHALERDEFRLYYQPIVFTATGQLAGFEALIRWNHPRRGLVGPGEFIPLAEETGLILPIGDWVLREACRQRKAWLQTFPQKSSFSVSVNLSAKQFVQKNLLDSIFQSLDGNGLSPEHINLEITESMVMENFEAAMALLQQLKNRKLHLHMDDFGTGYSSLSQLHRFPLDVLKIDQTFVRRMMEGAGQSRIVNTIITLAHELGMGVIAEGVETEGQFLALKELGCGEAQGYFFAKPLEARAAADLLALDAPWGGEGTGRK